MKVLHIVPYLPKASGVTTFVDEVSKQLVAKGVGCAVCVEMPRWNNQGMTVVEDVPRLSVSEALKQIGDFDVVHIHGIWRPCMHKFVVAARKFKKPIVWSLHGMLSPWAMKFKRWKKLPVWWLWQKRDLKYAAILHVTSEKEAEWVRAYGFDNRIVNIPLGTYLPSEIPDLRGKDKTLLFVGRIAPVKALDKLIRAWAMVENRAGWKLRIVGIEDFPGYTDGLKALSRDVAVEDLVEFPGPKFDAELEAEYRRASLLALVSETENFGGVVVDALAHGVPVVASKGTPWKDLTREGCGWWVDNTPTVIAKTLSLAIDKIKDENAHAHFSKAARELVEREYSWNVVGAKLLEGYSSI